MRIVDPGCSEVYIKPSADQFGGICLSSEGESRSSSIPCLPVCLVRIDMLLVELLEVLAGDSSTGLIFHRCGVFTGDQLSMKVKMRIAGRSGRYNW